ncbi:Hypothetical protein SMAX5B_017102 [Scophthalmus maximus]|uniref:Uncharacterized protein n=1 Tax=Scophthalmus maximus TaxID=52904 RepID=A0A2U9BAR0_SCOMX|nr:Hypothetical protein SMAX5B_017102 [Scophthalmus maximus]
MVKTLLLCRQTIRRKALKLQKCIFRRSAGLKCVGWRPTTLHTSLYLKKSPRTGWRHCHSSVLDWWLVGRSPAQEVAGSRSKSSIPTDDVTQAEHQSDFQGLSDQRRDDVRLASPPVTTEIHREQGEHQVQNTSMSGLSKHEKELPQPSPEAYEKWRLNKLKKKYNEYSKWWEQRDLAKCSRIENLEAKVASLQKEVRDGQGREGRLIWAFQQSQTQNEHVKKSKSDSNLAFTNKVKGLAKQVTDTKQELTDAHDHYQVALSEVEKEKDLDVVCLQRDMGACRRMAWQTQEEITAMRKEAERHERQALNLKRKLCEMEEEKARVIDNFVETLGEKDEVLEHERDLRKAAGLKSDISIQTLKQKIAQQAQVMKSLQEENQTVCDLQRTVSENRIALKNNAQQMALMTQKMETMHDELRNDSETAALLHAMVDELRKKNKHLEEERQQERQRTAVTIKETLSAFSEAKLKNMDLTDTVQKLTSEYPESYDKLRVDEETQESYQHMIDMLQKKVDNCETIIANNCRGNSRLQDKLQKAQKHVGTLRGHFVEIFNEKTLETDNLKKQLHAKRMPKASSSPVTSSRAELPEGGGGETVLPPEFCPKLRGYRREGNEDTRTVDSSDVEFSWRLATDERTCCSSLNPQDQVVVVACQDERREVCMILFKWIEDKDHDSYEGNGDLTPYARDDGASLSEQQQKTQCGIMGVVVHTRQYL